MVVFNFLVMFPVGSHTGSSYIATSIEVALPTLSEASGLYVSPALTSKIQVVQRRLQGRKKWHLLGNLLVTDVAQL